MTQQTDRIDLKIFASPQELAAGLAGDVATQLQAAIEQKSRASLAVSGGQTPKQFFAHLSNADIDWQKVTITLVDERWVGPESERSNARLVAENLIQNKAERAAFLPLYQQGGSLADSLEGTGKKLAETVLPLDVAILGMGGDGHTASFFPGGSDLASATNPQTDAIVSPMQADGAGEPRITLTLPPLLNAGFLALHIEGEAKRGVLQAALGEGASDDLPIRHVLRNLGLHDREKLQIYWAP